jgi:protein-S-isoprenylcysteine O-methyltransferase Ste14
MSRILSYVYGAVSYVAFLVAFLYAIGFVANRVVPKSIDSGEPSALVPALLVNTALLLLFAVQHSVMARPWFKRWWTRFVPSPVERSTFVLFASLVLMLLYWQWRPLPAVIWSLDGPAAVAMEILFWTGWGIVLLSTFMISHFHLFGLTQVHHHLLGKQVADPEFQVAGFYRMVRHPIMAGFFIAFWSTPKMTVGHLLFAAATTGYILVALQFEEHDLVEMFGEKYRQYRREVPMLIPFRKRRGPRVQVDTPAPQTHEPV